MSGWDAIGYAVAWLIGSLAFGVAATVVCAMGWFFGIWWDQLASDSRWGKKLGDLGPTPDDVAKME